MINVPAKVFYQASVFASKESSFDALTGIYIDKHRIMSLDGHNLFKYEDKSTTFNTGKAMPYMFSKELIKACKLKKASHVTIKINRLMVVDYKGRELYVEPGTMKRGGDYPGFEKIINGKEKIGLKSIGVPTDFFEKVRVAFGKMARIEMQFTGKEKPIICNLHDYGGCEKYMLIFMPIHLSPDNGLEW